MRKLGVLSHELHSEFRITRADPTINISSDLRANPVVIGIVRAFSDIKPCLATLREPLLAMNEQGPIGRSLGGISRCEWEVFQPVLRHLGGRQCFAVLLQHHECQHRIIDIVIRLAASDMTQTARRLRGNHRVRARIRDVIPERERIGKFQLFE